MYYNQNNYASVPYPSPSLPSATVKSGGCGVCCASMVVEGLTGKTWPPGQSAAYSIKIGARVSGGTDMRLLGKSVAAEFGLTFGTSNDVDALISHLQAGGMAAVNVGGDRTGYTGLFSDLGHFIVAAGAKDGKLVILDPGYYSGKFNKTGRAGKVTVDYPKIYVAPEYLDQDAASRSPRYYLFAKEEKSLTAEEAKKIVKEKAGLSDATIQYIADDYRYGDALIIKLATAMRLL